jgi:hypothetical protein
MMDPSAQLQPTGHFIRFGLPDGTSLDLEVLREPQTLKEFVCCDQCQTVVSLRTNRNLRGFETHRSSKRCKKSATQVIRATTAADRQGSLSLQPTPSLGESFHVKY